MTISRTLKKSIFWVISDFGVFPAPEQADFLQRQHLRRWAGNFQKVWYEKFFEKFFEKHLNFPEIYFGHAGTI